MTIKAPTVSALSSTIASLAFALAAMSQCVASAQDAAALAKRVQQLEEQLVDMQVVVGTLESTSAAGGAAVAGMGPAYAPPPGGGYGGASDAARLDGIETQIQALTAQMEQLSRDVRALSTGQRGGLASPQERSYANAPQAPVAAQQLSDAPGAYGGSFGTTTVTPGRDDGIGGLLSGDGFAAGSGGGGGGGGGSIKVTCTTCSSSSSASSVPKGSMRNMKTVMCKAMAKAIAVTRVQLNLAPGSSSLINVCVMETR